MPLRRSTLILGIALVMGVLAAVAIHQTLERKVQDIEARGKTKTLRVLVPKEDLPKGTPLTTRVVAVREIPAEWVHSNAVTPEQFDRIENQKLAYPAARGEALLWSLLEGQRAPSFSSRLVAGRRAITVPVDDVSSISGMVEPGDRIEPHRRVGPYISERHIARDGDGPIIHRRVKLVSSDDARAHLGSD